METTPEKTLVRLTLANGEDLDFTLDAAEAKGLPGDLASRCNRMNSPFYRLPDTDEGLVQHVKAADVSVIWMAPYVSYEPLSPLADPEETDADAEHTAAFARFLEVGWNHLEDAERDTLESRPDEFGSLLLPVLTDPGEDADDETPLPEPGGLPVPPEIAELLHAELQAGDEARAHAADFVREGPAPTEEEILLPGPEAPQIADVQPETPAPDAPEEPKPASRSRKK